jgi:hypothetical protein
LLMQRGSMASSRPPRPGMEEIPAPPADLAKRDLPLTTLAERNLALYRCHRTDAPYSPVAFNFRNIDDRFNAPNGEYGMLYLGTDPFCSFIESFGSSMVSAALELRLVSEKDLQRRCLCEIEIDADPGTLRLVNLADGYGFSRLGIDGRISTTKQRAVTRQWALELWSHSQQPDGILYHACNDAERLSVALFDRVGDILRPTCDRYNVLRDPQRLAEILDYYEIGLDSD